MEQRLFSWHKKETSRLCPVTMLSAKKKLKGLSLMSHSYFTRKLLNIKDKHITFEKDYLEEVKMKGVTSFILRAFYPINRLIASTAALFLILNLKSMDSKPLESSFQKFHFMILI